MSEWESGDEASLQDELEKIFEKRLQRRQTIKIVVFGVLGLIGVVVLVLVVPNPNLRRPDALTIGEEAIVSVTSMVGVDEDALSDMTDLQVANDQVGLNLLQREGRAFMLDGGTPVLIIDTGFTIVMVRALEGRNTGKTGWLQYGRPRP